jgi:sec-independent protein translocase protein TatC
VARLRARKPGPDDELSVVEHLDELRTRIIIAIVAFAVGFGLCFWQNHEVLDILNHPLPDGRKPITFGVTEPFLTTVTVSAYGGLALALPVILYQVYAFVLPAFSPGERRVALPVMLLAPVLFAGGIAFGYFIVLDRAVDFLLNFNESQFNIQIRARDYYSFVALTLLSLGLVFEVPLAIVAVTRVGIVTPQQLRQWRRYAYFLIAILAALLPTVDPVSMILEMVPLIVLFELSIVLASLLGGSGRERAPAEPSAEGSG